MRIKLPSPRSSELALTLIEMMVSTVCLMIIILGLTAMFIQTQKAFKSGLKQNDTSDNGRTIADLLVRDLSQLAAGQSINVTNCIFTFRTVPSGLGFTPVTQNDANGQPLRTNQLSDVFFINRIGSAWDSVGYAVLPALGPNNSIGLGTLYRYAPPPLSGSPTNRPPPISAEGVAALLAQYQIFTTTNWMNDRVADGVIHLQIHAYDINGLEFPYQTNGPTISLTFPAPNPTNSALRINLPTSLELELGVLEPEALEHVRALANVPQQLSYLSNHAGQVQIFRQQIPIKTATR